MGDEELHVPRAFQANLIVLRVDCQGCIGANLYSNHAFPEGMHGRTSLEELF